MTFDEYQAEARKTAIYPKEFGLGYVALGLSGEAGEVANKVKKVYRDGNGVLSLEDRHAIVEELGDLCWYCAMLCEELGVPFSAVAAGNVQKLADRAKRNTLHGAGDNR